MTLLLIVLIFLVWWGMNWFVAVTLPLTHLGVRWYAFFRELFAFIAGGLMVWVIK